MALVALQLAVVQPAPLGASFSFLLFSLQQQLGRRRRTRRGTVRGEEGIQRPSICQSSSIASFSSSSGPTPHRRRRKPGHTSTLGGAGYRSSAAAAEEACSSRRMMMGIGIPAVGVSRSRRHGLHAAAPSGGRGIDPPKLPGPAGQHYLGTAAVRPAVRKCGVEALALVFLLVSEALPPAEPRTRPGCRRRVAARPRRGGAPSC